MPHQVTAELSTRKREGYAREKKKGTCYLNKKTHRVDVSGSRCVRAQNRTWGGVCACDPRRPEKPEACLKTTHAKAGEEKPASLASDRLGAGARGWGWLRYGIVIPYPG
jgi:hypothetical protein